MRITAKSSKHPGKNAMGISMGERNQVNLGTNVIIERRGGSESKTNEDSKSLLVERGEYMWHSREWELSHGGRRTAEWPAESSQ